MSTKKEIEKELKKAKKTAQTKGTNTTKKKEIGENIKESKGIVFPPEEQAAIDAIKGKRTIVENNQLIQNVEFPVNEAVDQVVKSNDPPFCVIENYAIRTLKEDNTEKTPINELKEKIENMSLKEFALLFEDIVSYFINVRNEEKKKPETRCVEDLLINHFYVFEKQYFDNIETIYPSVIKLNQCLDFSLTPGFSREPEPAIYGVKPNHGKAAITKMPLKKDEIEKIIDAEINTEHIYTAGKWIYSVLSFSEEKLKACLDNPEAEVLKDCQDTHNMVSAKLSTNKEYQNALTLFLFSQDRISLADIISNSVLLEETNEKKTVQISELKSESDRLNKRLQDVLTEFRQCEEENKTIPDLKSQLAYLKDRNEAIIKRLETQIEMNEDVVLGKKKAIQEADQQINKLVLKCNTLSEKDEENANLIASLTREKENLESDLQNERMRGASIRSDSEKAISKAKEELTADFIGAIKDQLNHFAKAFSYFKEEGYDEDTLDVCIDDYNSMIESLSPFGIKPIGVPGQKLPYNIDEHYSEEIIESNALVQIVSAGWKVWGNVISKAEVERVEE